MAEEAQYISPEEMADIAEKCRERGNIGIAFTYNEPLIGYEYVRDTAMLIREKGMKNVMVTNGTADIKILDEISPYIDAMNIDLKGFSQGYYRDVLGGDLEMVLYFIKKAVKTCHVEITTLIVPGENDSEEEIREISGWIAGLKDAKGNTIGKSIPLHISRFFPRFHMTDRDATEVRSIYRLSEVARDSLDFVYPGNV